MNKIVDVATNGFDESNIEAFAEQVTKYNVEQQSAIMHLIFGMQELRFVSDLQRRIILSWLYLYLQKIKSNDDNQCKVPKTKIDYAEEDVPTWLELQYYFTEFFNNN